MSGKVLIVFDGREGGMIDRMAKSVASGVRTAGLTAICESVENASMADLENYQGVILGSPCYFAGPSAKMKKFMDESWGLRGKLKGKIGGAFTASEHIGGGNEMTLHALLDFFLVHGMIVQGDCEGDYFGPIAVKSGCDRDDVVVDDSGECARLGERVARLVGKLA
jgi:NAD(P)H dehydrogenase (quinone)